MRIAALISSTVSSSPPKYFSMSFVGLGDRLEQLLAVLRSLLDQVGRDLLDRRLGTGRHDAAPGDGLLLDEVDDAVEVVLGTDRELQDQRLGAETVLMV